MIEQSQVYKCLEKKTLILGFELPDLFALSIMLCALNLVFGASDYKLFFTWGPTLLLALFLRLMKAGKAENFLLHWVRYHLTPGILQAFPVTADENAFYRLKRKGHLDARFYFSKAN